MLMVCVTTISACPFYRGFLSSPWILCVYKRLTYPRSLNVLLSFPPLVSFLWPLQVPLSCGSLLLYRPRYSLYSSFLDSVGRFFHATFSYNDVTFHVICLYAPNQDPSRSDFFQFDTDHVDPGSPTIICGDFNSVFDRTRDRRGFAAAASPQDSPGALTTLFGDCCEVDSWRHLHPHTTAFTWLRPDGSFSSRISLVGCPIPWLHHVRVCDILGILGAQKALFLPSTLVGWREDTSKGPCHSF